VAGVTGSPTPSGGVHTVISETGSTMLSFFGSRRALRQRLVHLVLFGTRR